MPTKTNRKVVIKGIQILAATLPLMFLGPVIINNAFKNQEHPFYPFVLALGITVCGLAIFLAFKGLNTMTRGFFDGEKQ